MFLLLGTTTITTILWRQFHVSIAWYYDHYHYFMETVPCFYCLALRPLSLFYGDSSMFLHNMFKSSAKRKTPVVDSNVLFKSWSGWIVSFYGIFKPTWGPLDLYVRLLRMETKLHFTSHWRHSIFFLVILHNNDIRHITLIVLHNNSIIL